MKAMYIGEQRDIGRFGTLRRGDVVTLAPHEWASVREEDQTWLEADSEAAKKIKVAKLELDADTVARIKFAAKQLPADAMRELALMPPAEKAKKGNELIAAREKEMLAAALRELTERHEAALGQANDPNRVLSEELHGMNREELLRKAQALRGDGKAISFTEDATKNVLIRAIKGALGVALTDGDEGE